jgi:hypothetical protein
MTSSGDDARVWVDQGARIILYAVHSLLRTGAADFFRSVRGSGG